MSTKAYKALPLPRIEIVTSPVKQAARDYLRVRVLLKSDSGGCKCLMDEINNNIHDAAMTLAQEWSDLLGFPVFEVEQKQRTVYSYSVIKRPS